jgi:hypothetical protein
MRLKEKIQDVEIEKGMSDRLEQITDDFAIGFAEWIRIKDYQTTHKNTWIGVDMEHYLTTKLLEIYKKEKGL